jgi:putative superfamily III holin-X
LSTEPPEISELGRAVDDVREKIQLLVSEEIALAKAELAEKVSKLIKGAVVGIVAAVFAFFALIYLLEALSWGIYDFGWSGTTHYWVGFLIVAGLLLLFGGLGAFVAARLIKRATPPTPQMALEEGKLIKETLQHPHPLPARGPGAPEPRR